MCSWVARSLVNDVRISVIYNSKTNKLSRFIGV